MLNKYNGLPGSEYSSLWLNAFRQFTQPQQDSIFDYCHCYVTANIGNAYRYALNPYRSELVQAIAESLKLLTSLNHPLPDAVKSRFPKIFRAIHSPSPPVVFEFKGISSDRLATDRGSYEIEDALELISDVNCEGVSAPAAFRVSNIKKKDLVAIHNLSDWLDEEYDEYGQPKEFTIAKRRRTTFEWLS